MNLIFNYYHFIKINIVKPSKEILEELNIKRINDQVSALKDHLGYLLRNKYNEFSNSLPNKVFICPSCKCENYYDCEQCTGNGVIFDIDIDKMFSSQLFVDLFHSPSITENNFDIQNLSIDESSSKNNLHYVDQSWGFGTCSLADHLSGNLNLVDFWFEYFNKHIPYKQEWLNKIDSLDNNLKELKRQKDKSWCADEEKRKSEENQLLMDLFS